MGVPLMEMTPYTQQPLTASNPSERGVESHMPMLPHDEILAQRYEGLMQGTIATMAAVSS